MNEKIEKIENILIDLSKEINNIKKELLNKKEEKIIEEKIFNICRKLYQNNELYCLNYDLDMYSFKNYYISTGYNEIKKQHLFLDIMKAVHYYIEGDKKEYDEWYCIYFDNNIETYDINSWGTYIFYPYYFNFISKENAEKAKEILSNFFGINLLDWWYK